LLSSKLESKAAPATAESAASGPKADDGAAAVQVQTVSVAADDQAASAPAVGSASAQLAPSVAEDVDVIEPEWVKKAEEAVAANREDPRAEESAVEAIQIEYLKTRYNLDVKPSEEQP